jgi:hypothetical protein
MNDEMREFKDIEAELQSLQPRRPSPILARRIERKLRRRRKARPLPWVRLATMAAVACVIIAAMIWRPGVGLLDGSGDGPLATGCSVAPFGTAEFAVISPRRVRLDAGELYVQFDRELAGGEPFVVETPSGEARAMGTRFYVETACGPAKTKGTEKMSSGKSKIAAMTRVVVLAGLVQLVNDAGVVSGGPGEALGAEGAAAPKKHVADLTGKFGQFYEPVDVDVKPSIPAYTLPLTPKKVANWADATKKLGLGAAAQAKLKANGFVVIPLPALRDKNRRPVPKDDITKPYEGLKIAGVPIFVTTDTLLHLYHVQFDETLKDIEEREFYGDISVLGDFLVGELGQAYQAKGLKPIEKTALKKAWTYASIGYKCLEPKWTPPADIADDVAIVIAKMEAHKGFWPDPRAASRQWPLFRYAEDFSQYVPRGHYTRSEILKRYFKGMMWFGRMSFILKGGKSFGPNDQPFLVSKEEARAQTIAASHIVKLLAGGKVKDGRTAREIWQRVYTVTAFYVGLADDLGLAEYESSLRKVTGAAMNLRLLVDEGNWRKVQVELAKFNPPAIYGGTGAQGTFGGANPDKLVEALDKSTGFRLMGQRYIPDSYMMGKLVTPTVGKPNNGRTDMFTCVVTQDGPYRCFPRGLDVMAVMGSKRAEFWLKKLGDDAYGTVPDLRQGKNLRYDAVLGALKKEFADLSHSDWNRNAYWSWLYALKPLLEEYGKGYPTFMTTDAWGDKSMTTALASWSQLRHDTILYAKQSYTMTMRKSARPPGPRLKPVEGYVEPTAEFYARLLATTRMTLAGLKDMKVLEPVAVDRLKALDTLIARLLDIAKKQLAHKELTAQDYAYIRNFGEALEKIRVKDPKLQKEMDEARKKKDWKRYREISQQITANKSMKTTIIADVHTDQNSKKCLEEGTGYVELTVVCYLQPDGRLVLGAGPTLSYHEFKHPMSDRLTDEKWREMLKSGKIPPRAEWIQTFSAAGAPITPQRPGPGPGRPRPRR